MISTVKVTREIILINVLSNQFVFCFNAIVYFDTKEILQNCKILHLFLN